MCRIITVLDTGIIQGRNDAEFCLESAAWVSQFSAKWPLLKRSPALWNLTPRHNPSLSFSALTDCRWQLRAINSTNFNDVVYKLHLEPLIQITWWKNCFSSNFALFTPFSRVFYKLLSEGMLWDCVQLVFYLQKAWEFIVLHFSLNEPFWGWLFASLICPSPHFVPLPPSWKLHTMCARQVTLWDWCYSCNNKSETLPSRKKKAGTLPPFTLAFLSVPKQA